MDKKELFISVIIPCYNEEENLKKNVLKEVYDYLKIKNYDWEIIISDDGSTDRSREIIKKQIVAMNGFRILENFHGGKPSTLRYGIDAAKGDYILITDMDQSAPITELDKFIPYLDKGFEIVIGSRGLKRKDFPIYRKLGAAVFSTFRRALILPEIFDTQCGFKLFKREPLAKAFPKLEFFTKKKKVVGWTVTSFDVELLHILKKSGCKIKEIEVKWNDRDISTSKGGAIEKYIKESKEMVMQILRVKLNEIRGMYN